MSSKWETPWFKCDTDDKLRMCLEQYLCGLLTYAEFQYRLHEYHLNRAG
jgi:hypothetical protein